MRALLMLFLGLSLSGCDPNKPTVANRPSSDATVSVAGSMRATLFDGKLDGMIDLDTVERAGLYGLGPAEYLRGEVLVLDGVGYRSRVTGPADMVVEQTLDLDPPFFVYTHQHEWYEYTIPANVLDMPQLLDYLDRLTEDRLRPFVFRLSGPVESATIHVQNLAPGVVPRSPKEAHRGQQNYVLRNRQVDMLGFFSTTHQGVFTHHDSYGHVHLITRDRTLMGHLDEVTFGENLKLYLRE